MAPFFLWKHLMETYLVLSIKTLSPASQMPVTGRSHFFLVRKSGSLSSQMSVKESLITQHSSQ
jgi:hypothetical protein